MRGSFASPPAQMPVSVRFVASDQPTQSGDSSPLAVCEVGVARCCRQPCTAGKHEEFQVYFQNKIGSDDACFAPRHSFNYENAGKVREKKHSPAYEPSTKELCNAAMVISYRFMHFSTCVYLNKSLYYVFLFLIVFFA